MPRETIFHIQCATHDACHCRCSFCKYMTVRVLLCSIIFIWETAKYSCPCMQKYYRKKWICLKCVTRKFGFVYLRFEPLCRNSFKSSLIIIGLSQLTRWCSGNASALGASCRVQFLRPARVLCLIFSFVVVVFLLFCVQNTLFVTEYYNFFFKVNILVYLSYCKICDRLLKIHVQTSVFKD